MIRRLPGFLLLMSLAGPAVAQTANPPPPSSPFRYDDDPKLVAGAPTDDFYAKIKFIPLTDDSYLSFGADLRERVEASNVGLLGFRNLGSDTYDLHRLLVYADLQLGSDVRVFGQLGNHDEAGRRPGALPTDVDRLDLQQAFVDLSHAIGDGRATLRVGRAEMSYDDGAIIGLRDGPNVRQVWDGVRASYVTNGWKWDAFAVQPVSVLRGVFDDRGLPGQTLEGVHVSGTLNDALGLDAFWYHNRNPSVALLGAAGAERTDTFGVRIRERAGPFDGSVGVIGQSGTATGGRDVRAFSLHGDAGWALANAPWSPHLTLRADVLSGGPATTKRVSTFNALYPNVAYSTEATIEAPANLVQVGTVLRASPTAKLNLQYTLEGLWRYSVRDAFYAPPSLPLIVPDGRNDRFTGIEQQLSGGWRASPFVTVGAALVRFSAGDFVKRGGGHDETFAMLCAALRL
jgi:hypothetical protein